MQFDTRLQVTKTKSNPDRTVRFNDLEAGTVYVIQAVTRSGSKMSDPRSITITTGEQINLKLSNCVAYI